ncbi:glucosaminidase domain-containing protein [Clostridium sp. CS001]|uniref:N-acetylglucosaminidase n=1 Tax=Clostridium sp. CS001 TaxID=2880648 RepID=UPI001CF2D55B|nr:glucosaminidase domain-containing protein [Clostridium sp. CS001]MCB2291245.1 glucosaminidase domain-containing protein [Clostridium sp. CS001]
MTSKNFMDKLKLILVIMCGLFLMASNEVIAATSPTQMESKINVSTDKVWQIKFNQAINVDNLSKKVMVYNPIGLSAQVTVSYDNNIITVKPPKDGYISGQTYSLQIYETITDLSGNPLKAAVIMNFTIVAPDNGGLTNNGNKSYIYKSYDNDLDQIVDIQSKLSPVNVVAKYSLIPSKTDIYQYMNPKNFENHDCAIYQFLKLNYIEGVEAEELDAILKGKGFLEGQGKIFLDACKEYDVNPAYVIAHAILETGNGSSLLSKGILVSEVKGVPKESKLTYNMFGIGARDIDANKLGSERAYEEGWFTPEDAIKGGIKWISSQYINNDTYKQNTLYKMKWNPDIPLTQEYRHQYATDIAWAYKQSYKIKEILDKCQNANLIFEIPQYK